MRDEVWSGMVGGGRVLAACVVCWWVLLACRWLGVWVVGRIVRRG